MVQLTEEQIDKIAEKAADKAIAKITQNIYTEVGRGVLKRMFWILGTVIVGAWVWLRSGGWVKWF